MASQTSANGSAVPAPVPDAAAKKVERRKRFEAVFPLIKQELLEYLDECKMPSDARAWFDRNLEYNTPGGKLNRGMSVVDTVEILKGSELSEAEYLQAAILGWGIELLQAYFLVADDMMDQSITRRGHPCWYKVEGVNNIAINDAFMLEAAIYFLLKKHFRKLPCYVGLLELFHDVTFQTELGQLIDLITAPEDSVDLSKFSLEKHSLIVIYKTAYYSFYLPVALAMQIFGIQDEKAYKVAEDILIPMGEYFQIQDDFLDCYADPETLGKIGTDILDNKCSWVINTALAHVTPEQRAILDSNYGRKNAESEALCKNVFLEVDIPSKYAAYEANFYEKINKQIDEVDESCGLKKDVLRSFLSKIYKRQK
ncbi:terpenoid synthase [Cystobasidium minutum MCA 4210]|uniref:terpenoid synthase n=1 Tax=Cystobasidium minutum MCA 4210 TaxID=1397322 RepID=UPI0034CD96AC|eukprot:jgi/Rhomi1/172362/fgenesh1_kg.5_\